jgi:NDP-sugar pyrophosphorylase family protein
VYVIGFRGDQIRRAVGDGTEFGLAVSYVDEGDQLHGTGGALRFALDSAALAGAFGLLYGDSYLPIDLAPVWSAFVDGGHLALMTVLRNEDRWDRSNVVLDKDVVTLYEKHPEARDPRMAWIDYGFSAFVRDVVGGIPAGASADLGETFRELSERGQLAGYEVSERFYEAGSPEGVSELERFLAADVNRNELKP